MKILPKKINLKQNVSERKNSEFLEIPSRSDSRIIVRESGGKPTEANAFDNNDSTVIQNTGAIVKWSPAMQSMLEEPPSNLPFKLIMGGVAFCCSFFLWAWFGEVEEMGKARGKLLPKGNSYKVESLESAKVSHIAVEEGEVVGAGQLIAELDAESEAREVERLENTLLSYRTQLNQKRHLLEKVEVEANTHQQIAKAEVQAHQSSIDSAIAQSEMTDKILAQRESELVAYSNRQQNVSDLSQLDREKLAQLNAELAEHQQRLARLKPLVEQGAISQEFIFQAQQAERQTKQQLIENKLQSIGNVNAQIFQSEQSLREMEAKITQSLGELAATRNEIARLQAELEQKKAERQRIALEAQQKTEQLKLEIAQTEAEISETENLLASAKSKLKKKSLVAPVAGTVLSFDVLNTGEIVQAGETVAEVAPNGSPLVLSALLPDREAGFVKIGMPAQVKFDAYSYQDYGVIPGKVISVSADAKFDEKLGEVYQVEIELERNYVVDDAEKIAFKPGQTATADIVVRRRRIIDLLLDPIKKIERDGIDL